MQIFELDDGCWNETKNEVVGAVLLAATVNDRKVQVKLFETSEALRDDFRRLPFPPFEGPITIMMVSAVISPEGDLGWRWFATPTPEERSTK